MDDDDDDEPEAKPAAAGEPPLVRLATTVLDRLLADELVTLVRSGQRGALRDDLADALVKLLDSGARGAALAEWLSEHKAVDDVFASDDDLERVLAQAAGAVR